MRRWKKSKQNLVKKIFGDPWNFGCSDPGNELQMYESCFQQFFFTNICYDLFSAAQSWEKRSYLSKFFLPITFLFHLLKLWKKLVKTFVVKWAHNIFPIYWFFGTAAWSNNSLVASKPPKFCVPFLTKFCLLFFQLLKNSFNRENFCWLTN